MIINGLPVGTIELEAIRARLKNFSTETPQKERTSEEQVVKILRDTRFKDLRGHLDPGLSHLMNGEVLSMNVQWFLGEVEGELKQRV